MNTIALSRDHHELTIAIIMAVAENFVIGNNDQLPWRMADDLKHFKKMTLGKPVIMGRTTYESLAKPLSRRLNIVITRRKDYVVPVDNADVVVCHSIDEAIQAASQYCDRNNTDEIIVAGGAEIYQQFFPMTKKLYITRILANPSGNVRSDLVANIKPEQWQVEEYKEISASDKNEFPAQITVYKRE